MGKLRFLFALWMAKLSVPALKITRHNGTDFPGTLALKLCPDFLKYVGRPKTIIAVTGTNGKTTVSNLLADTLEKEGHRVLINRAGSNVASGIATALLKGCDLAGRVKNYDMAVLRWTSGPVCGGIPTSPRTISPLPICSGTASCATPTRNLSRTSSAAASPPPLSWCSTPTT